MFLFHCVHLLRFQNSLVQHLKKINDISVVAVMILGRGISGKENILFDLNVLFIINGMAF